MSTESEPRDVEIGCFRFRVSLAGTLVEEPGCTGIWRPLESFTNPLAPAIRRIADLEAENERLRDQCRHAERLGELHR